MTIPFQRSPASAPAQQRAAQRVGWLLAQRSRAEQIRHLCDTRALHRLLARLSTKRRPNGAAGRYRSAGEPVFVRVKCRHDAPLMSTTCPPERLELEMEMLAAQIRSLLTDPPDPGQCRSELTAILATFFRIHPYSDGNGRIARILFHRAAMLLELPLNERWTLEPRGYGAGMSLAIETYPLSPRFLESYLQRFFDAPGGADGLQGVI